MNDKELLELAAKAAGIDTRLIDGVPIMSPSGEWQTSTKFWNPLTDDGDALRLAASCEMDLYITRLQTLANKDGVSAKENHDGDKLSATRRAIVRAAAEIGRKMP